MSVEITGMAALERALEARLGPAQTQRISDEALKDASLVFKDILLSQLSTFSGTEGTTGATKDELVLTEPYTLNGARTITVHWRGPKNRYRIIHLNEFGTVKNPNPRGKGAIARALQSAERSYQQTIETALRRAIQWT